MSIKWNPNSLAWHLRSSAIYPYSANNFINQRSPSAEAFSDVIFGLALSSLRLNIFFALCPILITPLKMGTTFPILFIQLIFLHCTYHLPRLYNLPTYYIYFFPPQNICSMKNQRFVSVLSSIITPVFGIVLCLHSLSISFLPLKFLFSCT